MAKSNTPPAGTEKVKSAAGSFDFDGATGETFAGLNILKLEKGQAAGPFVLQRTEQMTKSGKNKKMRPVTVYITTDSTGMEVRMPIAAGFTSKAKDAKLAIGDTFALKRETEDYQSKYGKKDCASYILKVLARAGSK